MKQHASSSRQETLARSALRRRVMQWYDRFNDQDWTACYRFVDPQLTSTGKVNEEFYVESVLRFHDRYGVVRPWHIRVSVHVTGPRTASDRRPFAYVYTVWQDKENEFHMFRERWVREGKRWYTRVAGLLVNESPREPG